MNEAWSHGLAFYFNEVKECEGSPIRSWGGWTVTVDGHRFLEDPRDQS